MGSLVVQLHFHLGHGWSCVKCQLYQGSVQSGRTFAPEPSVEVRWPFLRIKKNANSFFPRVIDTADIFRLITWDVVGHCFCKEVKVVVWQGVQGVKQHEIGRVNSSPQELDTETWDQVDSWPFGIRVSGRAHTNQSLHVCSSLKNTKSRNVFQG